MFDELPRPQTDAGPGPGGRSRRLTRRFFSRSTLLVAEALLGRTLVRQTEGGTVAGRLVEVEAYCGAQDPASHAFSRMTPRNSIMFGPAGHLYVYFTYGMHHCANIVTESPGVAGAVLLRAVEPTAGIDLMSARRGLSDLRLLAAGPGRLCQAFALTRADDGTDLESGDVWVSRTRRLKGRVMTSSRIGLRPGMEQPWRFFEPGPWTSRGPGGTGGTAAP